MRVEASLGRAFSRLIANWSERICLPSASVVSRTRPVRSSMVYVVLSAPLPRPSTIAARRMRHGKQYPQCWLGRCCHLPFDGEEQDSETGTRLLSSSLSAHDATISPLVLSQYGFTIWPGIPKIFSTSFHRAI